MISPNMSRSRSRVDGIVENGEASAPVMLWEWALPVAAAGCCDGVVVDEDPSADTLTMSGIDRVFRSFLGAEL